MTNTLLIMLIVSLIYMVVANRLYTYITILAFQGFVLFGVAFIELIEVNTVNLIFILIETIIFKALAIPVFLNYVIKKNNLTREAEPFISNFVSVVAITIIIIASFLLSNAIRDEQLKSIFFVVALTALFTGLYVIVTRRKVITHVMGFLVIENGVFILSLAVGNEMPMIVNTGIMLDLFVSVLALGIFVNKIGDVLKEHDTEQLKQLKD
ncbi:MAG TPA: NADH-quinone oxidoreductase subunit K [Cyclobacteriaceae bacterium]|nr:NADH-quinone oxidoreductase subunit K [Cyclobacteriaceae bacterium]